MDDFDEWFIASPRNTGNDKLFKNKQGLRMAFAAGKISGLLEAADILEFNDEHGACDATVSDIVEEAWSLMHEAAHRVKNG